MCCSESVCEWCVLCSITGSQFGHTRSEILNFFPTPFFLVSLYMPMQLIDDLDQDRINYYKDRYIMSYGRWCANPSS